MATLNVRQARGILSQAYAWFPWALGIGVLLFIVIAVVGGLNKNWPGVIVVLVFAPFYWFIIPKIWAWPVSWFTKIFCDHCGKFNSADAVWICGYCDHKNETTRAYPFFYCCEKCTATPLACICQHCSNLITIEKGATERYAARCIVVAPKAVDESTRIEKRRQKHEERKELRTQKIEVAALDKKLAQFRASPEFKKEISERERIEQEFSTIQARTLGVKMLERSERLKNAQMFKDDPETWEMHEMAVDEFVQQHGLTPTRLRE